MSGVNRTETRELTEHERLAQIREKSQEIGTFLEWLGEQGIQLCDRHTHTSGCYGHPDAEDPDDADWPQCGYREHAFTPHFEPIQKLLARFYGIDLNKLEREKRQMLADIRKQHAAKEIEKELGL